MHHELQNRVKSLSPFEAKGAVIPLRDNAATASLFPTNVPLVFAPEFPVKSWLSRNQAHFNFKRRKRHAENRQDYYRGRREGGEMGPTYRAQLRPPHPDRQSPYRLE